MRQPHTWRTLPVRRRPPCARVALHAALRRLTLSLRQGPRPLSPALTTGGTSPPASHPRPGGDPVSPLTSPSVPCTSCVPTPGAPGVLDPLTLALASGWTKGNPPGVDAGAMLADLEAASQSECERCGRKIGFPGGYTTLHRDGAYRAFVRCPQCGQRQEL